MKQVPGCASRSRSCSSVRLLGRLFVVVCFASSAAAASAQSTAGRDPYYGAKPTVPQSGPDQTSLDRWPTTQPTPQRPAPEPLSQSHPNVLPASNAGQAGQKYEPSRVLALVGGYPIFVADIMPEAEEMIDRYAPDMPASIRKTESEKLVLRLLPKYIDQKMMFVDAVRSLPDAANIDDIFEKAGQQFDEHILPEIMEKMGANSALEVDAILRSRGSSLRRARHAWVESEFVKYMVRSKIDAEPQISHHQMLQYYQQHREQFAVPARARWEQLTVRFDRFPDRASAQRAIAEMGNEVVYGASLAAVARSRSHALSAENGGLNDWTVKNSLVDKNLDQAIFSLELNRLSDIIETNNAFHIVRVLERSDAGYVPFLDAQIEIKKKLAAEAREQSFNQFLQRLKAEIPVDILDDQVRVAVEQFRQQDSPQRR